MTTLPPLCLWCLHFQEHQNCVAFPNGIPEEIWRGRHDHLLPYSGDQGIRFEFKKEINQQTLDNLNQHRKWLEFGPYDVKNGKLVPGNLAPGDLPKSLRELQSS